MHTRWENIDIIFLGSRASRPYARLLGTCNRGHNTKGRQPRRPAATAFEIHDSYCDSCFAYAAHRYITSLCSACWYTTILVSLLPANANHERGLSPSLPATTLGCREGRSSFNAATSTDTLLGATPLAGQCHTQPYRMLHPTVPCATILSLRGERRYHYRKRRRETFQLGGSLRAIRSRLDER